MSWAEFENALNAGQIAPAYLFCGQEDYLLELAVKILRSRILGQECTPFNYQEIDGQQVTAGDISELACTIPMAAEMRLIIVKNPAFFQKSIAEIEIQPLLDYLEAPLPTTCLVFVVGGKLNKQERLVQAVARVGKVIEFLRLKREEFNSWLKEEAGRYGRKINPRAVALLGQYCSFDLRLALQEIEKIDLYLEPGREITAEAVLENTPFALAENAVFMMVDALGERKPVVAIQFLRELLAKGEAPLIILGMIARQLRLIFLCKLMGEKGDLAEALEVHPFVAQKIKKQAANFSFPELEQAFRFLFKADLGLKSSTGDAGLLLEQAVWHLCKIKGAG